MRTPDESEGSGVLAVAVVLRMAFHAVSLPAFEGPDEPQHLARIWDFARRPLAEAFAGRGGRGEIVSAVAAYPCRESLPATLGCPAVRRGPGRFDLLRSPPPLRARALPSPTSKPTSRRSSTPLAGLGCSRRFPVGVPAALLYARLLAVALRRGRALRAAAVGRERASRRGLAAAGLLALLLPGAAEGLRALLQRGRGVPVGVARPRGAREAVRRPWAIVLLLAAGPADQADGDPDRRLRGGGAGGGESAVRLAAAAGAASLLVFPLQAARGWLWGGTLELNFPGGPTGETPLAGGRRASCAPRTRS